VIQDKTSPSHFIRQWRKHHGLTQAELAAAIDIDRTYLNKIERGKRGYMPHVLEAIASELGCKPGDLISRHPQHGSEIETLCKSLSAAEQQRAVAVLKTVFSR
jgi:transcriptional regulator with XRE-family HTH domain